MKTPPPNPQWEYTPPAVSKDGRIVRVDAMQLPMALELYRVFKVPEVGAAYLAKGKRNAR